MKRNSILAAAAILLLIFFSCKEKVQNESVAQSNLPEEEEQIVPKKYTNENGSICVIFGYGFNDDKFYDDALEKLGAIYGLDDEGGLIFPLRYPEDFKSKIDNLYEKVDKKNLRGMIFLGAPEKTYIALYKIKESVYGNANIPYSIFSFFPQDDTLGQESICDLVVEYERSAAEEATKTEIEMPIDENAERVVISAIEYMANINGPMKTDGNLHERVQTIVGPDNRIHRYTDSDSGIQALNHYVMEKR